MLPWIFETPSIALQALQISVGRETDGGPQHTSMWLMRNCTLIEVLRSVRRVVTCAERITIHALIPGKINATESDAVSRLIDISSEISSAESALRSQTRGGLIRASATFDSKAMGFEMGAVRRPTHRLAQV